MLKLFPQNRALSEALEAEISGNHSLAFEILSPFWSDLSKMPETDGLSVGESAEVYLRCGSVVGFLGRSRKIENAQEIARKLLGVALERFQDLDLKEKIAECENIIALTYERIGKIPEAREHLQKALEIEIPQTHPTRLYSHIIESLLNLAESNYLVILEHCAVQENIFLENANSLFKGCFFNNYGLALKNLNRNDEALEKLLTARYWFTKAEHFVYCGLAENNLARLYTKDGRFIEAHHFAQKAENTFKLVGDVSREGFSLNTRAEIFLAEENFEKALEFTENSLKILEVDENLFYKTKVLKTKGDCLTKLGKLAEAKPIFEKALQIADKLDEKIRIELKSEIQSTIES